MKIKSKQLLTALLMLFFSVSLLAQNSVEVKGKVVDKSGVPLIGVNLLVKGAKTGSITDIDGNFIIKNAKPGDVLTVSYIGYVSKEVKIAGSQFLSLVLEEQSKALNEVVVVAYGAQKKATLTGALSQISSKELLKSPSASVTNTLAGAMTGVSSVQFSGKPGSDDAKIYIRGVGSLTDDASSPLILVDGVERPFSQMDPNEIESINILKDASATAVFGVRGANGVILVTTKRGTEGVTKIGVTSSFGMQIPTRLLDNANSYTYALASNETYANDGSPVPFSDAKLKLIRDHSAPLIFSDVNWRELLLKSSAMQTQHNLTISGGTKSVRYFTSVGYLYQDGLFNTFGLDYNSNFDFKRMNYRTNIDIDVTKTTQMQFNLGGRLEKRNEPNFESKDGTLWQQINSASPLGGAGVVDNKLFVSDTYYLPELKDGLKPWYGRGFNNETKNVLNIDFSLTQKLDMVTKGLNFGVRASYNGNYSYTKTRSSTVQSNTAFFKRDVGGAPTDSTVVYKTSGASTELDYGETYGVARDWYIEAALRYARQFDKHSLSGLLLFNESKKYYPGFISNNNASNADYWDNPSGYVGLVGRVAYDYDNKYMVEFNVGYNGSENFAQGKNRYGLFPAMSLGWALTQEKFMKHQKMFDLVKLRASCGLVGNDKLLINGRPMRFMYLPGAYSTGEKGYNFGINVSQNMPGVLEGAIGVPDVTWEKALKQNYGVDLSFLNQRMTVTADYFYENRWDILWTRVTTPGFVIKQPVGENIGQVENWGFETSAKWDQKIGKDFRFFVQANVTFSRNKVIAMDEIPVPYEYMSKTGQPVGVPFGRKFYGFYQTGMTYPDGTTIATHSPALQPGDAVYYDLNQDGLINEKDETRIGYGNRPEYTIGLRHGFSYKGFDLTMQWTGATNVDRTLGDVFRYPMSKNVNRTLFQYMYDERWTPETAATAKSPRFSVNSANNNYYNSDLWVRDASYIRLKNIELGYTFKAKVLKKAGLDNLRIYTNGFNLLTFDNLKVLDPEEKGNGGGDYPLTKIINFGLSAQF